MTFDLLTRRFARTGEDAEDVEKQIVGAEAVSKGEITPEFDALLDHLQEVVDRSVKARPDLWESDFREEWA